MLEKIEKKRITVYLCFAFGVSWITGLVIFLTGGLENSPTFQVAGTSISLAYILLATLYMFGPAIANIATRVVTREGKAALCLKPKFSKRRWIYFLAAWVLPGILIIIGMVVFFLIFPEHYDNDFSFLKAQLNLASGSTEINPWIIVAAQAIQAILISPVLNAMPTFGEEFGWRGYLQPKLMPLGSRKAVLFTGIIWGIWHWPVILMGYNYGIDYVGAPYLGLIGMVWFTLSLSVIFGWLTIKTKNLWPAVIAHSAVNGIAGISLLFVKGSPNTLLGPTPVGLIGGLGLTLTAIMIFLWPDALASNVNETA